MPEFRLETNRLLLREFVSEDAQDFFELNSNPEVMRYTGDECLVSVEQARKELIERPIQDYRKFGFGRWAVTLKENGKLIGFAGLKFLDDLDEVDLGYRILPDYWGRGLATEASQASVNYGCNEAQLPRIVGLVIPQNVGSVRVLEKVGFVFEKMIDHRSQRLAQYVIESLLADGDSHPRLAMS